MDFEKFLPILSIAGTIFLGLLQFISQKSKSKKEDTEASSLIVTTAMNLNKHELETLRMIITDLKQENSEKDAEIDKLKKIINLLQNELDDLKKKVRLIEEKGNG